MTISAFGRQVKVFVFFLGLLASLSVVLADRFNMIMLVILMLMFGMLTLISWVNIRIF